METREIITLDARAQHRLFILNHVLTGGLTAEEAARVLGLSTRQSAGCSDAIGPTMPRAWSTATVSGPRPTASPPRSASGPSSSPRRPMPGSTTATWPCCSPSASALTSGSPPWWPASTMPSGGCPAARSAPRRMPSATAPRWPRRPIIMGCRAPSTPTATQRSSASSEPSADARRAVHRQAQPDPGRARPRRGGASAGSAPTRPRPRVGSSACGAPSRIGSSASCAWRPWPDGLRSEAVLCCHYRCRVSRDSTVSWPGSRPRPAAASRWSELGRAIGHPQGATRRQPVGQSRGSVRRARSGTGGSWPAPCPAAVPPDGGSTSARPRPARSGSIGRAEGLPAGRRSPLAQAVLWTRPVTDSLAAYADSPDLGRAEWRPVSRGPGSGRRSARHPASVRGRGGPRGRPSGRSRRRAPR